MKNKKILILELGEKLIKICEAQFLKGKKTINRLEVFELSEGITPKSLDSAFSKFSKTSYEKILISLPRAFFLIRFLQLPSQDKKEINNMLPFQLAKIVPYSLEDVLYDFSLIETAEGFSEFVVFLIQKKKISALLDFIEKRKITPSVITMSSTGLYNWLLFEKDYLDAEVSFPLVLIDIDKYSVDFLVVGTDGIVFSRSFLYSEDRDLLEGINQSLRIFEKQFGTYKFSKAVFTGNKREDIFEKVKLGEVIFIEYWDNFPIERDAKKQSIRYGLSFASILGTSIDSKVLQLDFSPKSLKKRRKGIGRRKRYLEIAIIGLEIIMIFGIFLSKYIFDKHSYLNLLNHKLEEIKVEAKELDEVMDKLKVLDKKLEKDVFFTEILYNTISSIPSDTQLTLLDFQENRIFSLKGYANEVSKIFDIATSLNKSRILKGVRVKYANKIKRKDKVTVEFLIEGAF